MRLIDADATPYTMLKVPYGQDAYSVIGKYIRDHITAIEDIIAVIKIDDITTNQLFMVDMNEENYFIWNNDWYEGEKDVALIDFFPVSEAINSSAQPDVVRCGQCKYAEVADKEDAQDGYTCQFHRGSVWFSGSYCSWAERRTE